VPDIAMWGAPGTGKTTFLGVLNIALNQRPYGITMTGSTQASVHALIQMTEVLNVRHEFPPATNAIDYYKWDLFNTRPRQSPPGGTAAPAKAAKITLKLTDPSGELMSNAMLSDPVRKELIDDIVDSAGILFMFDPIREFERGDAFSTTNGLLIELMAALASKDPENFEGKLPHYVAVCVTKFDEPKILETARRLGILRRDPHDPHDVPWVHNNDARKLLAALASVSGSGSGEMLVNALDTYFHPERVQVFVTSAVGFYVDPQSKRFDMDNPQNLVKEAAGMSGAGTSRIRGPLRPINIVEPVLWLSDHIPQ
jgi:hypothetical protein